MTLKHISFHESEVMRSLERIAVKQGHFDPTPEEMLASAVYKINAAKKVQPTDNVMADLLTLASVLRERGYESQASELESKLGLYKTAETHLYRVHDEDGEDVLNFAHPESAVQMDERGSPFGKVFSPTEKARIIREVVKKEPSGKLAVAAAMLKKNAQETPVATQEEFESKIDPKAKATSATIQEAAKNIRFSADVSKLNFAPYEKEIFSDSRSVVGDLFSKYASVEKQQIAVLLQAYNFFYAGRAVNANTILNNLPSLTSNKDAVINFAKQVNVDVSQEINTYVTDPSMWEKTPSIAGSSILATILGGPLVGAMAGSLTTAKAQIVKDKLLKSAALKIHQGLAAAYNSLISSRLGSATEKMQKEFSTSLSAINSAATSLDSVPTDIMKGGEINYDLVLSKINNANKTYMIAVKNHGHTISKILSAFDPERAAVFGEFTEKVPAEFSKALVNVAKNTGSHSEIVNLTNLNDALEAAATYWNSKSESLRAAGQTEPAATARQNSVEITTIKDILKKYANQQFVLVAAALNRSGAVPSDKLTSVKDLTAYLNYLISISAEKTASVKKNDLTKTALQPVPGSKVPGSPSLKGGPAASAPAGSGVGGAYQKPPAYPSGVYGRPTPEEKEKVIFMQQTLSHFAQALINKDEQEKLMKSLGASKEELNKWSQALVATGGKATFDGKWSTKTSNALKTINEIIAKAKAKKIYTGAGVVDKHNYQADAAQTIINDAAANVDKISSLASALRVGKYLGKKDEVDNTVLDVIPSVLNDENWKRLTGGVKPVRESNLSSLYNFYYFLDHYGIKKASSKEKLKKLAEHITSTDIVKEAQINVDVSGNMFGGENKAPAASRIPTKSNYETDPMVTGLNQPGRQYQFWPNAPGAPANKDRKIVEYYPQQSAQAPAAPAKQKPMAAQAPGLNINELEAALQWFWQRSQYALFMATNPADKDAQVDRAEMSKARVYVGYVTRLYNQFYSWKAKGEPSIATLPGGPMERGDKGGAYPKPGSKGSGRGGSEGYGVEVGEAGEAVEALRRPPFRDLIDIKELADRWGVPNGNLYMYIFERTLLNMRTIRGAYAPNVYATLVNENTQNYWANRAKQEGTSPLVYLAQALYYINVDLGKVFSRWYDTVKQSDQPREVVDRVVEQQERKLNEWSSVLQRLGADINNLVTYQRGRFGLK